MSQNDSMMAAVLLQEDDLPKAEVLRPKVLARLPQASTEIGQDSEDFHSLFRIGEVVCTLMLLPASVPLAQTDNCFGNAWYWPDAWKDLRGHKAHIIVAATGGADARVRAAILAQLTAAVIEAAPSATGVHFVNSDALWPAKSVLQMVPLGQPVAIAPLFVSTRLRADAEKGSLKKRLSAFTRGLADFGLLEIEARGFKGTPPQLSAYVLDFAAYLIEAGPVVADGDTVGPDEKTKITIRYEPSTLSRQNVYAMHFG